MHHFPGTSQAVVLVLIVQSFVSTSSSYSSLWCHGSHQDHRHCSFSNLCYSSFYEQFLFFHSPKSTVSGIDSPEEQKQLVKYSTVEGLDESYFDYVSLPENSFQNFTVTRVKESILIVKRWRPNDLAHVLHDDLLPLFFTMKHLCFGNVEECSRKYRLAFAGKESEGGMEMLYQFLSDQPILMLNELKKAKDHITCFSKALVGLDTETVWFDHGIGSRPSAPLDIDNIRASYIEEFRDFMLNKMETRIPASNHELEYSDIVFLYQEIGDSHQLLNHKELVLEAKREFHTSFGKPLDDIVVKTVNLDQHSADHILRTVAKTKILIGPHSSQLISGLFLPRNGVLIEIFPYGLTPDYEPFVRTLASIRGLSYLAIETKEKKNSIGFPNRSAAQGGLRHLKRDVRDAIINMAGVGDHGFQDPAYLYFAHQNTRVDLKSFQTTFAEACQRLKNPRGRKEEQNFIIPSKVFKIRCHIKLSKQESNVPFLKVTWEPPLNSNEVKSRINYEILVKSDEAGYSSEASTSENFANFFDVNLKFVSYVQIWLTAFTSSGLRGVEAIEMCNLDAEMTF